MKVRLFERLLEPLIKREVNARLAASPITDSNFFPGGLSDSYIDRYNYDRVKVLAECLRAWRINPL